MSDIVSAAVARNIDIKIGELSGEGAQQHVTQALERRYTPGAPAWHEAPEDAWSDRTYYGYPMLKAPVWQWYIPAYYFLGGAAGAALALGAAAQLHAPTLNPLVKRSQWLGTIGSTVGGLLLIADLGRPMRFLAMMRVFRPTSPMNMGVWILSGAAPFGTSAALFCGSRGWKGEFGKLMTYVGGVFGLALATYTGVLVGNSAIPLWYRSRRLLPFLFGASGLASAVSILDVVSDDPAANRLMLISGNTGRVAELVTAAAMERAVAKVPRAVRPLRHGVTGILWRGAAVCTAASVVLSMLPAKGRWKRIASGSLGALGSLCVRFAVHYAGVRSAKDPKAAFEDQRATPKQKALSNKPMERQLAAD